MEEDYSDRQKCNLPVLLFVAYNLVPKCVVVLDYIYVDLRMALDSRYLCDVQYDGEVQMRQSVLSLKILVVDRFGVFDVP